MKPITALRHKVAKARTDYLSAKQDWLYAQPGKELTHKVGIFREAEKEYFCLCVELYEAEIKNKTLDKKEAKD